jgi:two-component sensor histidine kinase
MEAINYTVKGKKLYVTVKWTVAPGYEETFGKVFVSIIDITERKHNEEQISASLKEKDILLKEVNHRVKNNLQVISSLLNLQVKHIKDPADVEVFRECQNRVKSMVFIHEKLYKSQDFARIDFSSYMRTLTGTLFQSYGVSSDRISLDIDVQDGLTLGVDRAIPCGLIINELVSNALKYAFSENCTGLIRISAKSSDGIYTLMVSDNGKGIPPGLDYRHAKSLGMQLVNTLTDQLEGSLELESSPDTGTMFKITFGELKDKRGSPGEL